MTENRQVLPLGDLVSWYIKHSLSLYQSNLSNYVAMRWSCEFRKPKVCQEWDLNPRLHWRPEYCNFSYWSKEYVLESGALDRSAILTTSYIPCPLVMWHWNSFLHLLAALARCTGRGKKSINTRRESMIAAERASQLRHRGMLIG